MTSVDISDHNRGSTRVCGSVNMRRERLAVYKTWLSMITLSSNCLPDAHAQAFDARNAERITVEQNTRRLCERIIAEVQNSMKT